MEDLRRSSEGRRCGSVSGLRILTLLDQEIDRMMSQPESSVSIVVTPEELALLKKHDFPCSESILTSARAMEDGIELIGSWSDFDSLAGWVAGEANYARKNRRPRQTRLLDSICDQIEDVLAAR
jgi:hypothetical protein